MSKSRNGAAGVLTVTRPASAVVLPVVLVLLCGAGSCAAAGSATRPPLAAIGTPSPCVNVTCALNPCDVTECKPPSQWECVPNYCTACDTNWKHKTTGLVIDTCPPSVCTFIFAPVCGVDGQTYPNECIAIFQEGVKVAYDGACMFPDECRQYRTYKPVCDSERRTWPNACVARVNGATDYTSGSCLAGGGCARCKTDAGCSRPNPCKDNPDYTCQTVFCPRKEVLDTGARATFIVCSAAYYSNDSGYPAEACYEAPDLAKATH